MTLEEAIEKMAEELAIDIKDGTLSVEEVEVLLRCKAEVDKEIAEKGYVESALTAEELTMPVEQFFARCLLRNMRH